MQQNQNILLKVIFFSIFSFQTIGQQKYWIVFKEKDFSQKPILSEKCKENRKNLSINEFQETDFNINSNYISTIKSLKINPLVQSKWLNAISARLDFFQIKEIKNLDFVQEIIPIESEVLIAKIKKETDFITFSHSHISTLTDDLKVDFAMKQIGIENFLQVGLSAKDVLIGVIDAGFYGAKDNPSLFHLFEKNKVLGYRDYVSPGKEDFFGVSETSSDFHGTEVLSAITGKNQEENVQTGLATDAKFYLARTDSGNREFRGEEDNWVAAMEWMDSLGVRLINTSLGYAKGFSNPKENYRPEQMDGKTSLVAKAAKIAVEEKGMIIVVSAGNEGDDTTWKIVSTPADVDGVIAVGATNERGLKMGYSSTGPEFIDFLKPNVSCFSLFGTSLAAPVITGFVACMLEANPKMSNKEVRKLLEQSSNLYPFGNNFVGFGFPHSEKVLSLMNGFEPKRSVKTIEVENGERQKEIQVAENQDIVIFHKKSPIHVISQEKMLSKYNFINLKKQNQEKQTTVVLDDEIIEVIWK